MNLHSVKLNKKVRVNKINIDDEKLKLRLLDLGFVKNEIVVKLYKAPLLDPTIVQIRNYKLAISNNILKQIEVV